MSDPPYTLEIPKARNNSRTRSNTDPDAPSCWTLPPNAFQSKPEQHQAAQASTAATKSAQHPSYIRISSHSEPTPPPNEALNTFLKGTQIMNPELPTDPNLQPSTPEGILRTIIDDERWSRHMIERWHIDISNRGLGVTFTPKPVERALYLVLLNALEDREKGRAKARLERQQGGEKAGGSDESAEERWEETREG